MSKAVCHPFVGADHPIGSSDRIGTGQRVAASLFVTLLTMVGVGYDNATLAQPVPGAAHHWNASTDNDGDTIWEDTGSLGNLPFGLLGSTQRVPITSKTLLTHAYRFDGVDDAATADAENITGVHNASFEVWFRPSEFISDGHARPIFENGNTPRGTSVGILGSNVLFAFAAGTSSRAALSFDLVGAGSSIDLTDLVQVVGIVDDTNNELRMFVNGGNEQKVAIPGANDFSSNDLMGLAFNQGRGGGGQSATSAVWDRFFAGDIALVQTYRSVLSAEQVQQNFRAYVPEPTIASGSLLLALGGCRYLRRHDR